MVQKRKRHKKPSSTFKALPLSVIFIIVVIVVALFYLRLSKTLLDLLGAVAALGGCNDEEKARLLPPPGSSQIMNPTTTTTTTSTTTNSLAYTQSFGYFDDLTNDQWKRAQEIHSKRFPNHYNDINKNAHTVGDRRNIDKLSASRIWNGDNFQEEFHCPFAQRIPTDSSGDGPKWVCDPHRLKNVPDCLVYSFGSNGKAEFEKGVKDEIGPHCEIHTFDPVSYNKRNGDFAQALKGYSTFHNWGLGTEQEAKRNKANNNMKTLQMIMEELGHTNRTVHIFKIDCEWCEWFTYKEWLNYDLRQILVETHNAPMPNAKDFFFDLHDAGYVIFSKEANFPNGGGGVEFAFLKLSTDFLQGKLYSKSN